MYFMKKKTIPVPTGKNNQHFKLNSYIKSLTFANLTAKTLWYCKYKQRQTFKQKYNN